MENKDNIQNADNRQSMDGIQNADNRQKINGRECMEKEREIQNREGRETGGYEETVEDKAAPEQNEVSGPAAECCHHRASPRPERELQQLKNRLSRMVGQLNGISRMLDENRYCGDILIQISAVESALQSFGYLVLKDHMETCVAEEIRKGNQDIISETVELVKKLK